MPAPTRFANLLKIKKDHLSSVESVLLEADLFLRVCLELKEYFRSEHSSYFRLMKFTKKMEDVMLDASFVSLMIKDILSSQEYTIEGVAQYTNFPEDIFYEIIAGLNVSPSASLLQRAIELHRMVRPKLYEAIIKKIHSEYQATA